jgi:urease accessory protein
MRTRVGRDGSLRLRFERRGSRTVLAAHRSTLPLQVLAPVALDDPAAVVSVLNPTGGLVGGDRLFMNIEVGVAAHACLTTPSATKVYRTAGADAEQEIRIVLGRGAILEWAPDHTIPFAGSALRQRIDIEVSDGARVILLDAFAAGRVGRGEAWQFRRLDSTITIRDDGGRIFLDRLCLRGGGEQWAALGMTEHHPYFATVVAVGVGEPDALARELAGVCTRLDGALGGAGALQRRGVVVRLLARQASPLAAALETIWAQSRRHLLNLPPLALRKL